MNEYQNLNSKVTKNILQNENGKPNHKTDILVNTQYHPKNTNSKFTHKSVNNFI